MSSDTLAVILYCPTSSPCSLDILISNLSSFLRPSTLYVNSGSCWSSTFDRLSKVTNTSAFLISNLPASILGKYPSEPL